MAKIVFMMNRITFIMNRKNRILLVAILLFCFTSHGFAQTIQGTVKSAKDNNPVMFANVALLKASDSSFIKGTTCDDKGRFHLETTAEQDSLWLRVSAIGFENQLVAISLPFPNDILELPSILLNEGVVTLDEVVITDKKPLYAVDGEKHLYNVSEDPSVQTGTASDALQNAPGVEVDAEGNITLRGTQSVEIWINDRPSHMSAEGLKQYIKMMPANTIERIEVISNPSARYGGGGSVVNIVTTAKIKRNEFFSFGANADSRPYVCPWISYVYANKKFSFNIYANCDYDEDVSDQRGSGMLLTDAGDTSRTQSFNSHQRSQCFHSYLYLNGHYDFDSVRTLSFWGGVYPASIHAVSYTEMTRTELLLSPSDYSYRDDDSARIPQMGYYGGLDYTHLIDTNGQRLSISSNANGFGSLFESQSSRCYAQLPQYDFVKKAKGHTPLSCNLSLEVDYTLPFAKRWEFELGGGVSYDRHSYGYAVDSILSEGTAHDALRSYNQQDAVFKYFGYATLLRRFGNFSVKVGTNAGQKFLSGDWNGYTRDSVNRSYFVWIPSVHLSYHTESMHNFSLSYTRRTSVPTPGQLTSFVEYSTDSYSVGNPNLQPSFTHNLECSWDKYFEHFGSVGIQGFYQASIDEVGTLLDIAYCDVFGRNVSFSHPVNIGGSSLGGASINLTYRPTAFFNARLSATAYWCEYNVQYRPNQMYADDGWTGQFRLNVWTKLWKKVQLFSTLNYRTQAIGVFSISSPCFTADMGLSADFFDRKLSLYFNVKDIFNTNIDSWKNTSPYNNNEGTMRTNSRYVSFGLTLRFGKMELEDQARQGNSSPEI